MKEKELREHADCGICHKKIGESGLPTFWVLDVGRYFIDFDAMRKQDGFAQMMGNPLIAMHMGVDAEMAALVGEKSTITVCETCMIEKIPFVMIAIEDNSNE